MIPKIAIVGRPNVGKSALFNRICQKRLSIVDEREGITRDRLYARVDLFGRPFDLIDTGGIDPRGTVPFNQEIKQQALAAVQEADGIIFVVDGQVGPNPLDKEVAIILHKSKKPIILAVNKMDNPENDYKTHEFLSLGISEMMPVSALQGNQIAELLEAMLDKLGPATEAMPEPEALPNTIRVAIVGRPNVGKSTLLNQLLEQDRSIVSPIAGTTRDSIDAPIQVNGQDYLLIDTAGIRRKKAEKEVVDKFAAIRTDEAIDRADVCLLVLDASDGLTIQEMRIASEIESQGKSCIILFNKWDLTKDLRMEHHMKGMKEAIPFLAHCPIICMSALERRNLGKIFPAIKEVHEQRYRRITTGQLNKFIEGCLRKYHPPLLWGKRLRIYYMTQTHAAPPRFMIFVNNPVLLIESYRKYLINQFREVYQFSGCPIKFELRGKKKKTLGDVATASSAPAGERLMIDQSII
jgi:GTP-binding protein